MGVIRTSIFMIVVGLVLPWRATAQDVTEQVWLEYMVEYPFANSFNLENSLTYSTLLGEPKWAALDYSPALEWSITQHIDLLAQAVFSYTNQTETYNTFELRPIIGTRIYFTPNQRVQTRLLLRLEQRNFKNLEDGEWTQTFRPRVRAEIIVPINRKTIFEDKMWYTITDAEVLFTDDEINERFANKFRLRIGAGYRLNYTWRFEFLYMHQASRTGTDENFTTSDNIFRFRVKHYLRKTKPSDLSGVGN
jgi:Protein of unknown function (DUF2490)